MLIVQNDSKRQIWTRFNWFHHDDLDSEDKIGLYFLLNIDYDSIKIDKVSQGDLTAPA